MRITLIALHFAEYSCRLAAALAKTHEVQLILSEPNVKAELGEEFEEFRQIPNLRMVLLPHQKSLRVFATNFFRLISSIRYFKPDIVHTHEDPKDYLVAALWVLKSSFPITMTVHDPIPHSGIDARDFYKSRRGRYQRFLRRACTRAITHGELLKADLISDEPRLSGYVSCIPHGPLGPIECRTDIPQSGNLLFFGRINEYKGLRYFLEAVLLLQKRGHQVTGVIAGQGDDLEPNIEVIRQNDCFELHNCFVSRRDLNELFSRCQLVVMPYIDATQSGVAAMAIGFCKPVIATRVGSIPEMVIDGEIGVLVEPRNALALADSIERFLSDPAYYARFSAAIARARITSHSWERIAQLTTNVYLDTVAMSGTTLTAHE